MPTDYQGALEKLQGWFLRRWPFIVIGLIALLHILKLIQVDGYAIILIVLASLPAILPLASKYLKSLKLGKDGFEAIVADNEGKTIAETKERTFTANAKSPLEVAAPKFPYFIDSRRILSTLWHYQKELFGEDSVRRWGFGVAIGASDYNEYRIGLDPLERDSLVSVDKRGICYLTNEGVTFCKEHRDILDGDGPFYTQFGPAPNF